ncbi:SEC14-like protein 2 isoform X1 [Hydra vulgaris]|uniref:SEC14-like protein 2 isoform X1 n=1 Tax=Hydra vulgaris TaxID=6087 RepID=UPI001F5E7820|nr:SEC14-like protein 2 isoform X1 [Hydra vulgaris]
MKQSFTKSSKVLQKYYPGNYFGFDRDNRPVFYDAIGQCDFFGILHAVKADEVIEYRRNLAKEGLRLASQRSEELGFKVTQITVVFDLDGLSLKSLWKPGVVLINKISSMYVKEFPGYTNKVICVNVPSVFPVAYTVVKPFLSTDIKNQIIILKANWRVEIQNHIHPDNLPEYYGGTCRDKNGSPKCEQFICYGGKVPNIYFNIENTEFEDFQSTTLTRKSKLTLKKEIKFPGTFLQWQFMTENGDILFGINYLGLEGDSQNFVAHSRKDSHLIMEEGVALCEEAGDYEIVFENDSWLHNKQLFYNIYTSEHEKKK